MESIPSGLIWEPPPAPPQLWGSPLTLPLTLAAFSTYPGPFLLTLDCQRDILHSIPWIWSAGVLSRLPTPQWRAPLVPGAAAPDLAPTTSACGQKPGFLSAVPRGPDATIARNKYFWLLARTKEMTTDTISPGTSLPLTLRPVKGLIHAESTKRARPGSTGTVILPKGVNPRADDAHPLLNSQFCLSRHPSSLLSTPSQGKSEECAKDDSVTSQLGLILGSLLLYVQNGPSGHAPGQKLAGPIHAQCRGQDPVTLGVQSKLLHLDLPNCEMKEITVCPQGHPKDKSKGSWNCPQAEHVCYTCHLLESWAWDEPLSQTPQGEGRGWVRGHSTPGPSVTALDSSGTRHQQGHAAWGGGTSCGDWAEPTCLITPRPVWAGAPRGQRSALSSQDPGSSASAQASCRSEPPGHSHGGARHSSSGRSGRTRTSRIPTRLGWQQGTGRASSGGDTEQGSSLSRRRWRASTPTKNLARLHSACLTAIRGAEAGPQEKRY